MAGSHKHSPAAELVGTLCFLTENVSFKSTVPLYSHSVKCVLDGQMGMLVTINPFVSQGFGSFLCYRMLKICMWTLENKWLPLENQAFKVSLINSFISKNKVFLIGKKKQDDLKYITNSFSWSSQICSYMNSSNCFEW